jgi:hypothetical protein
MHFILVLAFGGGSLLFWELLFYFIYHLEIPFLEQFKITTDPWPWKENKKDW